MTIGNTAVHIKGVLETQPVQAAAGKHHRCRFGEAGCAGLTSYRRRKVRVFSGPGNTDGGTLYCNHATHCPHERSGRAIE